MLRSVVGRIYYVSTFPRFHISRSDTTRHTVLILPRKMASSPPPLPPPLECCTAPLAFSRLHHIASYATAPLNVLPRSIPILVTELALRGPVACSHKTGAGDTCSPPAVGVTASCTICAQNVIYNVNDLD
jgi:hypothetical protein